MSLFDKFDRAMVWLAWVLGVVFGGYALLSVPWRKVSDFVLGVGAMAVDALSLPRWALLFLLAAAMAASALRALWRIYGELSEIRQILLRLLRGRM